MPQDTRPLVAYLKVQKATDLELLSHLRNSATKVEAELKRLGRQKGFGNQVRRDHQLRRSQIAIKQEMSRLWANVGDTVMAGKEASAAAAALAALNVSEDALLSKIFDKSDLEYMKAAAQETARSGLRSLEQRVSGTSYVPLSDSVYKNGAASNGKVDDLVNAALARGASWSELARDVKDFVNPNTPGGVQYAAKRLARTELNNSFHARQVAEGQKQPWVTALLWNLSGSHPVPDECNAYADDVHFDGGEPGQYKPEEVPPKPHPNCLCFTTPETESPDVFVNNFMKGKYDNYLEEEFPGLSPLTEKKASIVSPAPAKKTTAPPATKKAAPTAAKKATAPPPATKKAAPTAAEKAAPGKPPAFPLGPQDEAVARTVYRNMMRQRPGGLYKYESPRGLEHYSGYGYSDINDFLRGSKEAGTPTVKASVKSMDSAFRTGVSFNEDITVKRGVKRLNPDDYKPGEYVVEPGYTSTTVNPETATGFAKADGFDGWLIDIKVPRGTKTLIPGNDHGAEYEVLLNRNTKFKVHHVDKKNKQIWLEVVK